MKKNSIKKYSTFPLASVVHIQSGYNFRGKVEPTIDGTAKVVQTKDFNDDGTLDMISLVSVALEDIQENHLLQGGDILIRSRGGADFPAAIVPKVSMSTVAAFPILVVRADEQQVLPEYITWFINQRKTQSQLQALAQSTFIPTVSKKTLASLEVPVPPLAVQEQIVTLNRYLRYEAQLLQTISERRQALANRLLFQYAEAGEMPKALCQLAPAIHSIHPFRQGEMIS